ncbi:MAG: hypothetical protein KAX38_00330 [Candidatus Krumholzibacteria bacterium]|nr:hypothetical protein [Candidatus Krumholzibacteria bacterium]
MRRMLVILIVIVLASGALSASEKALLFRFKGIGVDEELIDAVTLIFQGALD